MSHGLDSRLISAQSEAVRIPIVQKEVTWETYEQGFKEVMHRLKRSGIEGAIFGDISNIAGHEGWIDRVCSEVGIKPIKPLWGSNSEQLLNDFTKEGFKALMVMAKADLFRKEWLGRKVNDAFIKDMLTLKKKADVDLCGELGEYHTFVYDGPIFKKRIEILNFRKRLMKGYWFLDVKDFRIVGK